MKALLVIACLALAGCGSFFGASLGTHSSRPGYKSCDTTIDVGAPLGLGFESKSGNTIVAAGVGTEHVRSCFAPPETGLGFTAVIVQKWRRGGQ